MRPYTTAAFVVLGLAAFACSPSPGAARSPLSLAEPSTTLPVEMTPLGQPCVADVPRTTAEGSDTVALWCGSGRFSMALLSNWERVTGKRFSAGAAYSYDDDPLSPPPPLSAQIQYPPRVLASTTWARARSGSSNTQTFYADGARLWVKTVVEVPLQFPTGTLLVVDRRLATPRDERFLREVLQLGPTTDLNDDAAIARAVEALPALGAGQYGELHVR